MTARREYPRCDRCRRRFGGQEAMRVAHTRNSDRCKTVRELRRNRLHRRADGSGPGGPGPTRRFRPGKPLLPENRPSAVLLRECIERGYITEGTTNAGDQGTRGEAA